MGSACNTNGGDEKFKQTIGGKARRLRLRLVDNIKINLRGIGLGGRDWINLTQDRDQWRALVNTVMKLRVLLNAGKFKEGSAS
jgi:hypothetical protein